MTTLTLRARLTLWYTGALLLALTMFAVVVVWQQGRIGLQRVDHELDAVSTTFGNVLLDELREGDPLPLAAQESIATVASPGYAVATLDQTGRPVAATWNGLTLPNPVPADLVRRSAWTTEHRAGDWRIHTQSVASGQQQLVLLVATPLAAMQRERREVIEAMAIGIPLVLLVAAGGGWWFTSMGLRPLHAMAQRASTLPLSGLLDLGESDRDDELGQLARAFNGLVARLRAALHSQRQFMADASHELRTPVSVMRSASEITLARGSREEQEYREALEIVGAQARRAGRLVEDMLVLARADAGGYPLRRDTLYLDDLVAESCRAMEILAAERQITLNTRTPPELSMQGDEDLLRRMLLNVVQNAVQHSPAGAAVSIDVSARADGLLLRIADEGPGIPESDQARIFDRFVQLDPARRAQGAGLGLPIARWIAESHGGTLSLESTSSHGSVFAIWLPAAVA